MKSLRETFANLMLEIGEKDPNLVVMVGDISHGILQPFAKAHPERYFNIGICEPSMVNLAAGLNKSGLIPVVHTIAPFLIERSYEQIKLDFGYQKLSINLVAVGGSFDYSQLGCSHHCYSDVSIMSHFKRARVITPGSNIELQETFKEVYNLDGINYFRLTENPHGQMIDKSLVKAGLGIKIHDGQDLTIATHGSQLKTACMARDQLIKNGISAEIIYFHTIKPFDKKIIINSVNKTKKLLTLEELSSHDGLYNLCLNSCYEINGIKIEKLSIEDFIHGYGTYDDLCKKAGISLEDTIKKAFNLIRN